jgi:hypothetical protein
MAQPGIDQDIVSFSEELGYPDVATFMSINPDKVRTTKSGAPYVLAGEEYPEFSVIEEFEMDDDSLQGIGTSGLTLAEDSPGPSKQLSMSPSEIVQDADTSVNITEALSTPDGAGDPEVEAQLQNFLTVNDQAEQEVIQTNLENPVLENAGEPTTEEVTLSATAKPKLSTEFMEFNPDGSQVRPGYFKDTTEQVKESGYKKEDVEYIAGLFETINKAQNELEGKGIKFDKQGIKATKEALEELRVNEESFKIQQEERVRAQKEREEKLLTDISTLNEEYRAVEIEPNRIFKNSSTGAKILAALSVGLGAYSASMTGGKNYALEIIDGAIADDIEAQKLELQQKGASIDDKRNLLNDLIKRGMSEAEAEQASRLMLYEKVQRTLKQKMLDIKDARIKENAQDLAKQLQIKNAETKAQLLLKSLTRQETVTTTKQLPTMQLKARLEGEKLRVKEKIKREMETTLGLPQKEKDARTVEGYIGLAPTAKAAEKMAEVETGTNSVIKQLDALIAYREKHGREMFDAKISKTGKGMGTAVALEFKSPAFFNLGVLSGPDLVLIDSFIPRDPTAWGFGIESQYKYAKEYVELKRDEMALGYGLIRERPEMDISKMDFKESAEQSREASLAEPAN